MYQLVQFFGLGWQSRGGKDFDATLRKPLRVAKAYAAIGPCDQNIFQD